jgi:hypothetical protein
VVGSAPSRRPRRILCKAEDESSKPKQVEAKVGEPSFPLFTADMAAFPRSKLDMLLRCDFNTTPNDSASTL